MNPRVADGLAVVIAIGWLVSVVADVFVDGYSPSPFTYMTMAGLASAVFGKRFVDGFRSTSFTDTPAKQERDERRAGIEAIRRSIREQQEGERRGR